jgi:single-stranded-DNA-specific exonuclease
METVWKLRQPAPDAARRLSRELGVAQCLGRLLAVRGFIEPESARRFLSTRLTDLGDPFLIPGMDAAVARIRKALERRERILIHGDYDVDGVAGSVLLHRLFTELGGESELVIPHRQEGYSITETSLRHVKDEKFTLCVTVDHGTCSPTEVAALGALGCEVIIVDHHVPVEGEAVAPALAILNPKLDPGGYPFRDLSAAGVAFVFADALTRSLAPRKPIGQRLGEFLVEALALAAMGTVTDQAPLFGENRILIRYGLRALAASRSPGMRALLENSGVTGEVSPADLATKLGPRLNAAGRVGSPMQAARLLLASSYSDALVRMAELEAHNRHRQQIEREMTDEAIHRTATEPALAGDGPIVLASDTWHAGVVGSVANRVAIQLFRPTVLIALKGDVGRGSGRATNGFDLRGALEQAAHLLIRFGGHRSAVGFEIRREHVDALREALNSSKTISRKETREERWLDTVANLDEWDASSVRRLSRLGPHGPANPVPIFVAEGVLMEGPVRAAGRSGKDLVFRVRHGPVVRRAILSESAGRAEEIRRLQGPLRLAYTPRLSGRSVTAEVEVLVRGLAPAGAPLEPCLPTAPEDQPAAS